MSDKIVTYRGRPINEMNREELIEVVYALGAQLKWQQESHMRAMDTWSAFNVNRAREQRRRENPVAAMLGLI